MKVRRYQPSDLHEILELFSNTIYFSCNKEYSLPELKAWVSSVNLADKFNKSLLKNNSFVLVNQDNKIISFCDISSSGYLDRLFVLPEYQGQGLGSKLLRIAEKSYLGNIISVHVSLTAFKFFLNQGYKTISKEQEIRQGLSLAYYVMQKDLRY